jgi:MOSC domain-containing protein YiiM
MSAAPARVLSVNVGGPRTIETPKGSVTTGVWKTPVAGRVKARGTNLDGDVQVDRDNHGGPYKAIYAYAAEDLAYWEQHLGRPLGPGALGENLTIVGINPNTALIGERWAVGSTLLEVSEPRSPCYRLALRHAEPKLVRDFAVAERPGAYLRIIQPGDIGAGDAIQVVWRPEHDVTIRLAFQAWLVDRSLIPRLRPALTHLSPAWQRWIDTDPDRPVRFE